MDLFVSGRLCLFGEHSDWAGQYRAVNPQIVPGMAIAVGTNQGIYARVAIDSDLRFKSVRGDRLDLAMTEDSLLNLAQTDHFYSYVAGTAYQVLTRYPVGGLAIDNDRMDLPLQKGLSSSAAVCVLVARAFNRLYNLRLSVAEETELAYWGERTTPSQCGRLDGACAYGKQPILMTFDGDRREIEPLTVADNLYLIIVDLAGSKNTQKILAELNQCYPVAQNSTAVGVQKYLGSINQDLVRQAIVAMQEGNTMKIGALMNQAQAQFDRYLVPACPQQLNAPLLHRLLQHPALQPDIYGGKGVGSQGDGTAQFIARSRDSRIQAIATINRDFPQMKCYELDIPQTQIAF